MLTRFALSLLLLLAILLPSSITALAQDEQEAVTEVTKLRTRYSKTYNLGDGTYRTEFVESPEFTRNTQGELVPYVFTQNSNYYQVQHPWNSARFYNYYTEVWNESFTSVVVYDDRWVVEYLNKQGRWTDASFYGVIRSYEVVSDGIKLKRTGNTNIGQRQDIYYYRDGSPAKLEIRITSTEAQTIRFVWQQSGIVASSESTRHEKVIGDSTVTGYQWNDSNGKPVWITSWTDELSLVNTVNVVAESHAQRRKATITFESISVGAGQTAVLDPDTFYPDADPEVSSVDGRTRRDGVNLTWADVRDGVGTYGSATPTSSPLAYIAAGGISNRWNELYRTIYLFNTASLPDDAVISSAVLSVYGWLKTDGLVITPSVAIVASTPISNTDVVAGDYTNLGTTLLSDVLTYAGWNVAGYNAFTLNAAGIAAVNMTGVSKFGARNKNYDIDNIQPAWVSGQNSSLHGYMSEQGDGFKPKLVITYTTLPTIVMSAATSITDISATLNGEVTGDGGDAGNVTVVVYWGDNDGGTTPGNWDSSTAPTLPAQPQGEVVFHYDAPGLAGGTTYYYNARATNAAGTSWGATQTFNTLTLAPTDFTLTDLGAITVNAEWTKNTPYTMVRVSRDGYPTSPSEGELIYYGDASSTNETGFALETTTYYWSAWGFAADNITYSADYATASIGGDDMETLASNLFFFVLLLAALGLTIALFGSRNAMLGFPSAIFWAIFGGYCYQQSTTTWDIYYLIFFASFGMAIFSMFAAYALKTKKEEAEEGDLYFDEGGDDDVKFIDEGGKGKDAGDELELDGEKPSRRIRDIRDRASRRRTRWE